MRQQRQKKRSARFRGCGMLELCCHLHVLCWHPCRLQAWELAAPEPVCRRILAICALAGP